MCMYTYSSAASRTRRKVSLGSPLMRKCHCADDGGRRRDHSCTCFGAKQRLCPREEEKRGSKRKLWSLGFKESFVLSRGRL